MMVGAAAFNPRGPDGIQPWKSRWLKASPDSTILNHTRKAKAVARGPVSPFVSGLQAFFEELKRRHVFRVATAYVVGAFFVLEGSQLLFDGLLVPDWAYRAVTVAVLAGFPLVLVLSWVFEWTRDGIRLEDASENQPAAPVAAADRDDKARAPLRAFAFVGLGIVIAIVGMGLSLPYMYARQEAAGGTDGAVSSRGDGFRLAASDGDDRAAARLAVLPFVSLTGGDDDGFADGLAEDVTAALAQLGSVDVVSRTTSEAYRGSDKTLRTIGEELGVGLILEGTIRRAGDRVRVTAQLIDAATDRHLWASSYDRDLTGDVFRTQSQLAQEIVAAIQSVVRPEQQEQAERRLEALALSDQGSQLLRRASPVYDEAAAQLFEQALQTDPTLPEAHAGLAQTLIARAPAGPGALVDSAAALAEHAIRLDPQMAEGHLARSFVMIVRGDVDSARVELRRAIDLDRTGEAVSHGLERIRQISPEALESAQRALSGVPQSGRTAPVEAPPATAGVPPAPQARGVDR